MTYRAFNPHTAYRLMFRMRLVDQALTKAWADGLLPGEYHSGIGEEGINAGMLMHLVDDDALALDHRSTGPLIGRGTDPEALMLEVLGADTGLNRGMAGHMHLMDLEARAAADGIVGAAGPLAVGQAVAARLLRPGSVAVAFHGEAAMNQGMLMEAYNMAVAWNLPVIFVCKDNQWSITTRSHAVTSTTPIQRAKAFGLATARAKGHDVRSVYAAAGPLIARARSGDGPGFLHATCHRPGGHFEGDPLLRLLHDPRGQARELLPGIRAAYATNTAPGLRERSRGAAVLARRIGRAATDWGSPGRKDPVRRGRHLLDSDRAKDIERAQIDEILPALARARESVAGRPVFGVGAGKGST
jgi:acetoin:2,6-dichlorophenolindophenol oxidoreductase subunit alpha